MSDGTNGNDGGTVVALWHSAAELAAELGISRRTLYRRVKAGRIAKQEVGGRTLYRPVTGDGTRGSDDRVPSVALSVSGDTSDTPFVTPVTPDLSPLVALTERLAAQVAALEREKAEALALGHRALDERDVLAAELSDAFGALRLANGSVRTLQEALEGVLDDVAAVAASPSAVLVRRRLRAVLAGC